MTDEQPTPSTHAYTYQPGAKKTLDHLRRYPRHYGALVLWLVAMLLIPTVASGASNQTAAPASASTGVGGGASSGSPTSAGDGAPTTPSSPAALGSAATSMLGGVTGTRPSSSSSPSPSASPSSPTPAPAGDEEEGEEGGEIESPVPAGPDGLAVPPPPALPLPPVPEELEPLLAAAGPLTTQGCSAIGLAAVVAAVVGPAAGDTVPFAQLLPYLSPVYSACATFPSPEGERTICAVDEQMRAAGYPADASGLAKTPNPIGIGVDVFFGIERALEAMTGQSPGIAQALADALGCHPDV